MHGNLFDTQYSPDFNEAWSRYRGPRNASKGDAFKAWGQVRNFRPELKAMLYCIDLYLSDIKKQKIAQAHFSTFLRQRRWEGYLDEAGRIIALPPSSFEPRRAFKASIDHPDLPEHRAPKRSVAEILAARGK